MEMRGQFSGPGGRRIVYRRWLREEAARGVIVIAHGYGEHSGRYNHAARWFNAKGYEVFALDHHGHGFSQGPRAFINSYDEATADIDQMIAVACQESGFAQPVLLGHSMGGSLALYYALDHSDSISALVLSGPAIGGPPSAPVRAVLTLLSKVAPHMGTKALDSSAVSRDEAVVTAYRADPLVTLGRIPARTAEQITRAMRRFSSEIGGLIVPTLYLHGEADRLVPIAPVQAVMRKMPKDLLTEITYPGLYHEILNEPERERVLEDINNWLSPISAVQVRQWAPLADMPD